MSSKHLFPAIDLDGWVKSPIKVADYLMSHFFLSEFNQTANFPDNVYSFAYFMQKNIESPNLLAQDLQDALTDYFSTQFSDVTAEIITSDKPDSNNLKNLNIYMVFKDSTGAEHNLARLINYSGNKVTEIISVNNG